MWLCWAEVGRVGRDPHNFAVGDVVTIAQRAHPLTWTILSIHQDLELDLGLPPADNAIALLESGATGRHRYEPVRNLTHFTWKGFQ